MSKKYIAPPGQKVTIEINRSQVQNPKLKARTPKGLLQSRQSDDYQARRLKPNFKYRFFDFGRFASGSDIPFSYAPEVTLDAKKYPTSTAAFGAAQWAALQAHALGQDMETLAETFAEMTPDVIEKYNIQVRDKIGAVRTIKPGQNYSFNVHGFQYDDATGELEFNGSIFDYEIRSQLCADIFSSYATGDDVKVTESSDPESEGVNFSFKKTTDFFMMPRLVFELGRSYVNYYTPIEDTDFGTYRTGILNLIYKPLPRELYLTDYFSAANGQTVYDNAAFNAAKDICEASAGSRFLINTARQPEAGSDTVLIGNMSAAASQFPDLLPDNTPYFYAAPGIRYAPAQFSTVSFPVSTPPFPPEDAERQNFVATNIDDPAGWQLIAIAKQKEKVFYIWYSPNVSPGVLFGASTITIWGNTPG